MISSCISFDSLKLALEKRIRRSIYKIDIHFNDFHHVFQVGNNENYSLQWDFELQSLRTPVPMDNIKYPLFYGDLYIKVKRDVGTSYTSLYRLSLKNYNIQGISDLTYAYREATGSYVFDYYVGGGISNPLPNDYKQDNFTPQNSSNLVFSNQLRYIVLTDASGSFEIEVDIFFEGYKIYFR